MNSKIEWLREKLSSMNIQGMIISNPINIKYLTGIEAEGTLLITRRENIYITDSRYIEYARTKVTIEDEIIVSEISEYTKDDYDGFFMFCENVGFEENYVTYKQYKTIQELYHCNNLVETEGIIEKKRIVKNEEEIQNIKKACELTDNCFSHIIKYIKKGMTEKEIAFEIEKYFLSNGAEDVSFKPIVASGPNSSKPHAIPTDRQIQSNDIITIDMGCKVNGYCSDMTRTIFVDKVPEYIKPIYDAVLKNYRISAREVRAERPIKEVCKIAQCDFDLGGYTLIHSLGHGIGLNNHEFPTINIKNPNNFKENQVITIEPGIYIAGKFGVRIEDTILVERNSSINLTKSEKNYIVI